MLHTNAVNYPETSGRINVMINGISSCCCQSASDRKKLETLWLKQWPKNCQNLRTKFLCVPWPNTLLFPLLVSLRLSGERQHRVRHGQWWWWAAGVHASVSESSISSKAAYLRGTRAQPVVRTCNGPAELRHPGGAGIRFRGGTVGGAWGVSVHGSHKVRRGLARLHSSISRLFTDVPRCRWIRK